MKQEKVDEAKQNIKLSEGLLVYASKGEFNEVQKLASQGANLKYVDQNNCSVVHFAAQSGCLDLLKYFRSQGIELDNEDNNGRSPLFFAVNNNKLETTRFLLDNNVWIDQCDQSDDVVLHIACRYGHKDIVQLLLQRAAKWHLLNKQKLNPIADSILNEKIHVTKLFQAKLTNFLEVVYQIYGEYSLLHLACGLGKLEAVKFLLELDPKLVNFNMVKNHLTPLHSALLGKNLLVIQHILAYKPDLYARTLDDQSIFDVIKGLDQKDQKDICKVMIGQVQDLQVKQKLEAFLQQDNIQVSTDKGVGYLGGDFKQEFAQLSREEQVYKVKQWANMTLNDLKNQQDKKFSQASLNKLMDLRDIQVEYLQYQAICAFRKDDSIRENVGDVDKIADIIEQVRTSQEASLKYRQDPNIRDILQKLNKLTLLLKQLGIKKQISIYELIIAKNFQKEIEKDNLQLQKFQKVVDCMIDEIIIIITDNKDQKAYTEMDNLDEQGIIKTSKVQESSKDAFQEPISQYDWQKMAKNLIVQLLCVAISLLCTYYFFGQSTEQEPSEQRTQMLNTLNKNIAYFEDYDSL